MQAQACCRFCRLLIGIIRSLRRAFSSIVGQCPRSRLKSERIGVRTAGPPMFRPQARHRTGLIEPDEPVELLRQRGFGVMALEFGVRPVDHADETFEARLEQAAAKSFMAAEFNQAALDARVMEQPP